MKRARAPEPCPCGGGAYFACCRPYHLGTPAPDAQALMRARYSAYALGLADYLLATWHPDTRPQQLDLADPPLCWIGLEVRDHAEESADSARVEFRARGKANGKAFRLHEISRFLRSGGCWLYVDGILLE